MQHGHTALMIAVYTKNEGITRLLIESGATLSLRDNVCDNIKYKLANYFANYQL